MKRTKVDTVPPDYDIEALAPHLSALGERLEKEIAALAGKKLALTLVIYTKPRACLISTEGEHTGARLRIVADDIDGGYTSRPKARH